MAGGKQSPRQQMINMMYLVLTALLALNVSKEILKAFYLMDTSMATTGVSIDEKINTVLTAFEQQAQNKASIRPYYEQAKKANQIKDDFVKYVDDIKQYLLDNTGGRKPVEPGDNGPGELMQMDNMEVHAQYFIKEGQNKGEELQNKVNKTREDLLALISKEEAAALKSQLVAEDPPHHTGETKHTWVGMYLEHAPLASVFAFLTKVQNDCRNTTSDVINQLAKNISKDQIKFDAVEAMIVPESNFVMAGDKFKARIFLTAFNSKDKSPVQVNGQDIEVDGGVANYEVVASGNGLQKVEGTITLATEEGPKPYKFNTEYTVYKSAATISADKMNLLYKGLENPISVSVPGFAPSQVTATMSGGGRLAKKPDGTYIATIDPRDRGTREVTVSASVKLSDGSTRVMGKQKYRVRPVPKPEGMLGTLQSGSTATVGNIRAQRSVFASLGQSFAFEGVKYNVLGYDVIIAPKRGQSIQITNRGGAVSGGVSSAFSRLKSGDQIVIVNIKAKGPDGTKDLLPIVITVQ